MKVELKHYTGIDLKHKEHFSYTFYIEGVSRALLQELMRHTHDPSVESTRYVIGDQLRNEKPFVSWLDRLYNFKLTYKVLERVKHEPYIFKLENIIEGKIKVIKNAQ